MQSPHKTLGAIDAGRVAAPQRRTLSLARYVQYLVAILQSSSPNVLFTGSLDVARRQMALHGKALLDQTLELAQRARAAIRAIPGLWCYGDELVGEYGIAEHDPTKLVIRVTDTGLTRQRVRGRVVVALQPDAWSLPIRGN